VPTRKQGAESRCGTAPLVANTRAPQRSADCSFVLGWLDAPGRKLFRAGWRRRTGIRAKTPEPQATSRRAGVNACTRQGAARPRINRAANPQAEAPRSRRVGPCSLLLLAYGPREQQSEPRGAPSAPKASRTVVPASLQVWIGFGVKRQSELNREMYFCGIG
jgi:hypothetical protein